MMDNCGRLAEDKYFTGYERRRHPRIFFPSEIGITGTFRISGTEEETIKANILNLSEGGMGCLASRRDGDKKMRVGSRLILTSIEGPTYLQFIGNQNIVGEVRWIQDHQLLENVAFGLEFQSLSQGVKEQIQRFVSSWPEGTHC